jgi:ABC-type transporter Mla subunit MlaD
MKDTQPNVKAAADGAADPLDESTREILNDYTRKFVTFIQHEKERVKKQAVDDAEKLVAEGERKARQAYEKAMRDARAESEAILARTRGAVREMVDEVSRLSETIADLKEKIEKDINDIAARLNKQEEAVGEALRKGEQAISEASGRLQADLEASSAGVVALKESLLERVKELVPESQPASAEAPAAAARGGEGGAPARSREAPEPVAATAAATAAAAARTTVAEGAPRPREGAPRRHADRTFVGPLKIELYNGNPGLYRRFSEGLAKTANLEISEIEDAIGDRMKMVVIAGQPLPLLSIISQMTFVRSAVADEDRLKVVLHQTDRWMG